MTWNPSGIFKSSCKHHQYNLWPRDNFECYSAWFQPSVKFILLKIAAGLRHEIQGGVTFNLNTVADQNYPGYSPKRENVASKQSAS